MLIASNVEVARDVSNTVFKIVANVYVTSVKYITAQPGRFARQQHGIWRMEHGQTAYQQSVGNSDWLLIPQCLTTLDKDQVQLFLIRP